MSAVSGLTLWAALLLGVRPENRPGPRERPRSGHGTEGRAVLLIAHEADSLDQVDEIVVLDQGRVAERGSHNELRNAGGHYRQMRKRTRARLRAA